MKAWLAGVYREVDGSGAHLIGYVGHDWFMDVDDAARADLMSVAVGSGGRGTGVFALSCAGDSFIRPAIEGAGAYIIALNRYLTFPHAATVHGIVTAIAAGYSPAAVHRQYARAFSEAQKTGLRWALKAFAMGPSDVAVIRLPTEAPVRTD